MADPLILDLANLSLIKKLLAIARSVLTEPVQESELREALRIIQSAEGKLRDLLNREG